MAAVRNKLREAYQNRACGEVNFRFLFRHGALATRSIGLKIEYEFTEVNELPG